MGRKSKRDARSKSTKKNLWLPSVGFAVVFGIFAFAFSSQSRLFSTPQTDDSPPTALVINLKRDKKRWKTTSTLLRNFGFHPQRFEAIDGNDLPKPKQRGPEAFTSKHLALGMSHIKAWMSVAQSNATAARPAFIFEDDALPHPHSTMKHVESTVQQVPSNFSILYLGHCYAHLFHNFSSEVKSPVALNGPAYCTHAYAITADGAKRLLQALHPLQDAVDREMAQYCRHFKDCYVAYPRWHRMKHSNSYGHGLFLQNWGEMPSVTQDTDRQTRLYFDDVIPGDDPAGM